MERYYERVNGLIQNDPAYQILTFLYEQHVFQLQNYQLNVAVKVQECLNLFGNACNAYEYEPVKSLINYENVSGIIKSIAELSELYNLFWYQFYTGESYRDLELKSKAALEETLQDVLTKVETAREKYHQQLNAFPKIRSLRNDMKSMVNELRSVSFQKSNGNSFSQLSLGQMLDRMADLASELEDSSEGGSAVAQIDVNKLEMTVPPDATRSASFTLSNLGNINLDYNINANINFESANKFKTSNQINTSVESGNGYSRKTPPKLINQTNNQSGDNSLPISAKNIKHTLKFNSSANMQQNNLLILDDGDDLPDDFIGYTRDNSSLVWSNVFILNGFDFQLKGLSFYMRTESVENNPVKIRISDSLGNLKTEFEQDLPLSEAGRWYTIQIDSSVEFKDGEVFWIEVQASGNIEFPAGVDANGLVSNSSYWMRIDGTS